MSTDLQAQLGHEVRRKPRIMIAGEFSAGKSRLINGLVGREVLPSQVTSTSLPPIWLVHGTGEGVTVGLDGQVQPLDFGSVEVEETLYCVLPVQAEILCHVDLIDTPGNSDPNIPAACWERMVGFADGLIWCTSAMQAWRQSEKSACADLPEDLRAWATLLVTHADRLPDETSVQKVLGRVRRESSGLFSEQRTISLIRATEVDAFAKDIMRHAGEFDLRGQDETNTDGLRVEAQDNTLASEDAEVETVDVDTDRPQSAEVVRLDFHLAQTDRDDPADLLKDLETVRLAVTDTDDQNAVQNPEDETAEQPKTGPAALLWQHMTEGLDLSDPAFLRDTVDAFITRLDSYSKTNDHTQTKPVSASKATRGT